MCTVLLYLHVLFVWKKIQQEISANWWSIADIVLLLFYILYRSPITVISFSCVIFFWVTTLCIEWTISIVEIRIRVGGLCPLKLYWKKPWNKSFVCLFVWNWSFLHFFTHLFHRTSFRCFHPSLPPQVLLIRLASYRISCSCSAVPVCLIHWFWLA